jgi:outer membrane protein OmpA-like peptidoglycan-associated protein
VATADFLVVHGVDRSRITTAGRGEGEPIATNATDLGRSQREPVTRRTTPAPRRPR